MPPPSASPRFEELLAHADWVVTEAGFGFDLGMSQLAARQDAERLCSSWRAEPHRRKSGQQPRQHLVPTRHPRAPRPGEKLGAGL